MKLIQLPNCLTISVKRQRIDHLPALHISHFSFKGLKKFCKLGPRLDRRARIQFGASTFWRKTMINQPGTMTNQPGTMKNHGSQPKTMKNQETTLKTMETNQKP